MPSEKTSLPHWRSFVGKQIPHALSEETSQRAEVGKLEPRLPLGKDSCQASEGLSLLA